MIRLTVLLCGGMFLVLLIAGQDKGQVRQGLMTPPAAPQVRAPIVASAPGRATQPKAIEAVFMPTQPVRVAPVVAVAPQAAEVTRPEIAQPEQAEPELAQPDLAQADVAQPEPQAQFATVSARSVNVRSGPSKTEAVIGRLVNGEQVLVVVEENPVEGWSLIRIEGDGIEGYVASRLLQPLTP